VDVLWYNVIWGFGKKFTKSMKPVFDKVFFGTIARYVQHLHTSYQIIFRSRAGICGVH